MQAGEQLREGRERDGRGRRRKAAAALAKEEEVEEEEEEACVAGGVGLRLRVLPSETLTPSG
jgi:hypothetical protein